MIESIPRGTVAIDAAQRIRTRIVEGGLRPGTWLRETTLAAELGISRNTLREAFRTLSNEGLIEQRVNRGARVTGPSKKSIIDLYRVRRLIEVVPLREALLGHPATYAMQAAIQRALAARTEGDWLEVGTADLDFHRAIVTLADSPRITALYEAIAGELRLAFWFVEDMAAFHHDFVDLNSQILESFQAGDAEGAAKLLEKYLAKSEDTVLRAYSFSAPASEV